MNKHDRLNRAKANLHGIDAAPKIRAALAELRVLYREGQRRADVDGQLPDDLILDVPVLAVENSVGNWKVETTTEIFQGQGGSFHAIDRTEKLATAELRWALAERMFATRFCTEEDAKTLAATARIYSVGSVPFCRIFSPGGL